MLFFSAMDVLSKIISHVLFVLIDSRGSINALLNVPIR